MFSVSSEGFAASPPMLQIPLCYTHLPLLRNVIFCCEATHHVLGCGWVPAEAERHTVSVCWWVLLGVLCTRLLDNLLQSLQPLSCSGDTTNRVRQPRETPNNHVHGATKLSFARLPNLEEEQAALITACSSKSAQISFFWP